MVDAPPPRTIEGETRLVKGEWGDLRRPEGEAAGVGQQRLEGEGGQRRERASGGAALGRAARWGIERSRARGAEGAIWCGQGRYFSSLLVGPRRTNPIRTSPPG